LNSTEQSPELRVIQKKKNRGIELVETPDVFAGHKWSEGSYSSDLAKHHHDFTLSLKVGTAN